MNKKIVVKGQLFKHGELIDKDITCDISYGIGSSGRLTGCGTAKTSEPFEIDRIHQLVEGISLEIEFDQPIEGVKRFYIEVKGEELSEEYGFQFSFPGGRPNKTN